MSTAKTYALIVRSPQGDAKTHRLEAGLAKEGMRIAATAGARYELLDQRSGVAPDTVRVMRKSKHLAVFFDGEAIPRLTIEDHFDEANLGQSLLVGKTESGHYYAYVPESAAASEAVNALADRPTSHGMVLGGNILPAWLSPPLETVAAPAASFAGLLPIVGGVAVLGLLAAAGNDSSTKNKDVGPTSNVGAGLAVSITTDANNDGWLNLSEMGTGNTTTVSASFDRDKVRVGDQLVFSVSNGDTVLPTQSHTLTAQNLTDGRVDLVLNGLLEGQNQRVQVNYVNQTEGPATDAQALDTAILDTTPIGFLLGTSSFDGNGLITLLTFNPSALETGAYRLTVGASVFQGTLTGQALQGDASHQIRQNFLTAQTTAKGSEVHLSLWDAAGNVATANAFASSFDDVTFTFDSTSYFVI